MEVVTCENVKEFLSLLDPADEQWDGWYFRGQVNSEYGLMPSVWRETISPGFEAFKKRINSEDMEKVESSISLPYLLKSTTPIKKEVIVEWILRVKFENYLISRFYEKSNNIGKEIDRNSHHKLKAYPSQYWLSGDTSWLSPLNFIGYFEKYKLTKDCRISGIEVFESDLPQHSGVPTRSLDWSTNPRKAAFFSIYNRRKNEAESKYLSVYALKLKKLSSSLKKIIVNGNCSSQNPIIILEGHLRAKNNFLHVQDALFTKMYGDFYFLEHGCWPSIEDLYGLNASEFFELRKVNLPTEYYAELADRLQRCGIFLSSLMPSYNYVAEEIRRDLELE